MKERVDLYRQVPPPRVEHPGVRGILQHKYHVDEERINLMVHKTAPVKYVRGGTHHTRGAPESVASGGKIGRATGRHPKEECVGAHPIRVPQWKAHGQVNLVDRLPDAQGRRRILWHWIGGGPLEYYYHNCGKLSR